MPRAAREGDPGVFHCSPFNIASGSPNVFINGSPAARMMGDGAVIHLKPGGKFCTPHMPKINSGAQTVLINRMPAARVGSSFAGCTSVASGSPDVEIGGPEIGGDSAFSLGLQALGYAKLAFNVGSLF